MTPRARIVKASLAHAAKPLFSFRPSDRQRRRIVLEEIEARLAAERAVQVAKAQAEEILATARLESAAAIATAVRQAEEEAHARMAGSWLALREAELQKLERQGDRILAVAVALAERLLCASLELDPARIAGLAREAIREAGAARHAQLDAHPLDAAALRSALAQAGNDTSSGIEVREDESLARGDLRLHTDLGVIDARLGSRFDRLAAAVRDAIE